MTVQEKIQKFDDQKAEAFANRYVGALSEAAMILMSSMGHRTRLFDVLANNPGVTSQELADLTSCRERYVREWLGVMVTSRVVDYDPRGKCYSLPAEHAAFLTRAASPNNMAVTSQFIGVAASVEDEMLVRFESGEGLHYDHFNRFHEVMAEDSSQLVVANLENGILPVVPGLREKLVLGINVADVACGAGRAMMKLAETFPNSTFTGFDLCAGAFAPTMAEAKEKGLDNLFFVAQDLGTVESIGSFELITAFDAVHDQKAPLAFLEMIKASLSADGVYLMQDIGGSRDLENNIENPFAPLLFTISSMHCTPISIGQGGPGLGAMWGVETAQEYLAKSGFETVETHRLEHDPINAYFVARA
ncbi:methyltransferase domain-containing protein [Thalassospira sp.]|uniref:class I SAM-dependent methyltransferase n=1 Tax=Thalassospira sp. TaxID=1912094 RepID=UPI0032EAD125